MWEVRRGKKVPEKKKWKVEKEEMYNILVCDDDREIVDAIEIYLTQEGYHVLKAYDGMQAIQMLEREEIQLLIIVFQCFLSL